MASGDQQERSRLYKFTKILTLKVAQIVVQSRQGKKITSELNSAKPIDNDFSSASSNLQWFNLSIPTAPEVDCDTKQVLNGEIIAALTNIFSIEISLKTIEGDEMMLELWTMRMIPECDMSMNSVSTIYYRMGVMLKSTLSISRITPAYKISRAQHRESYKIYHKIYGGLPKINLLGENFKTIKVSELRTAIGTIIIEVMYRTKMTILPNANQKLFNYNETETSEDKNNRDNLAVETFRNEHNMRKPVDLNKPLTAGAFVDVAIIKELHDTLRLQLPPEPPMSWLLAEKEKNKKTECLVISKKSDTVKSESSKEATSSSLPHTSSTAIEIPRIKDDKFSSLMEFPFADGSPITELANFYQECLQARSISEEWTDIAGEVSSSAGSEPLSQQLKKYEEAIPEFDNVVASMFNNSENI